MEEHVYIFVKNCKWQSGDNPALCVEGKRKMGSDGVTWAKLEGDLHSVLYVMCFVCLFSFSARLCEHHRNGYQKMSTFEEPAKG